MKTDEELENILKPHFEKNEKIASELTHENVLVCIQSNLENSLRYMSLIKGDIFEKLLKIHNEITDLIKWHKNKDDENYFIPDAEACFFDILKKIQLELSEIYEKINDSEDFYEKNLARPARNIDNFITEEDAEIDESILTKWNSLDEF